MKLWLFRATTAVLLLQSMLRPVLCWSSARLHKIITIHAEASSLGLSVQLEVVPDCHVWSSSYILYYMQLIVNINTSDMKVKGKVLPYSLPIVGPRADPAVQAVSMQVTF